MESEVQFSVSDQTITLPEPMQMEPMFFKMFFKNWKPNREGNNYRSRAVEYSRLI